MNAPTIIVLAIIAVIVGLAVWSMYRSKKKGGTCSGCCTSCPACMDYCQSQQGEEKPQ